MKGFWGPAFCCLLLLVALAPKANAQAANAQAHVAVAKNAAYEPGQDLTNLFDMCAEKAEDLIPNNHAVCDKLLRESDSSPREDGCAEAPRRRFQHCRSHVQ